MVRKTMQMCVAAVAVLMMVGSVNAGLITVSSTAPTVDGADIANMTWTDTATDKTFADTVNHGQSFTTGSAAAGYTLTSFSMQVNSNSRVDPLPPNKTWNLRLVTIAGDNTTTTTVVNETGLVSSGTWSQGDWFTWSFDTPVSLSPNTLYGIDIEVTNGGDWHGGIPYFRYNRSDDIANSYRYTRADGDPSTINASTSTDRVFHVDLAEAPEPASLALMGLGGLMMLRRRRA